MKDIMKNKFLRIYAVMLGLLLGSCLDDTTAPLDPENAENIIEFDNISIPVNPLGAVHPLWAVAFDYTAQEQFEVVIAYAGPDSNNKDIEVTIIPDEFVLDAYNEDVGTNYLMLPDAFYDFNGTVTIPKGQKKVSLPITVYPNMFDLTKQYALPLRIVSSSSGIISGNWGAAVFATVAKNQYHGTYHSTGYFQHPTAPRAIDQEKELGTVSANTNSTGHSDLGTLFLLTVNPDNTVTFVDGTFGSYPKGSITVNGEVYNNRYDPATKTYYLYYEYLGASGPRTIYEKLEFIE
jgi:hypothetical protein